jgi:hypothetical protein
LVERNLAKVEVESSRLFSRSKVSLERGLSGFFFYGKTLEASGYEEIFEDS